MGEYDGYAALSFDCYGTLIDWEAGISEALGRWAERRGVVAAAGELLGLFSEFETAIQSLSPAAAYPQILEETLRCIGARLGVPVDESDAAQFGRSVADWPPFRDSHTALRRLGERFRLVIVSNVDRHSFAASREALGVDFDRIITADEVGAYKPADAHFEALFRWLDEEGIARSALLHVAQSLYHDHEPAQRFGLDSVWIDRRAGQAGWGATPPPSTSEVRPTWAFPSLEAFARAAVNG